uniref:Uncharacterized protein n=1 Tax=Bracon brevicornis TaxID=1563983 RepID=A0A6V7HVR3_9HYME
MVVKVPEPRFENIQKTSLAELPVPLLSEYTYTTRQQVNVGENLTEAEKFHWDSNEMPLSPDYTDDRFTTTLQPT